MTKYEENTANGEILLYRTWKEYSGGYQDEETHEAKLTVSAEGTIILTESTAHDYFSPGSISNRSETKYELSVTELISVIKTTVAELNKKSKIESLREDIDNWHPDTCSVDELKDLMIELGKIEGKDFNVYMVEDKMYPSNKDEFEDVINDLDFTFDGILLACDKEGNCLLTDDIDQFGTTEDTGLTVKHIEEIASILDENHYIEHMTTKDD